MGENSFHPGDLVRGGHGVKQAGGGSVVEEGHPHQQPLVLHGDDVWHKDIGLSKDRTS